MQCCSADNTPATPVVTAVADNPAAQLELRFAPDVGGVTRVVQRRVCYPYVFLKPFWFGDQPTGIATAIIQSSSGGLFGGERLLQRLRLAPHAAVHLTNQAATIVHAKRGHAATVQRVELELGDNAYLEYLPEPVTLFPGAGLEQEVRVTLAPQSVLLYADGMLGHAPGGVEAAFAHYANCLEVYADDGRLLCAERSFVSGTDFVRSLHNTRGAWRACGLFVLAAPQERARHEVWVNLLNETLQAPGGADIYAASAPLPNQAGVLCRIAAADGAHLRAALEACWRAARLDLTGAAAPRRRK